MKLTLVSGNVVGLFSMYRYRRVSVRQNLDVSLIIGGMKHILNASVLQRSLFVVTQPIFRRALALGFTLLTTVMLVQSSGQPIVGPPAPPGAPDLKREIELTIGHIVVFTSLVVLWWWAFLPDLPSRRALFVAVGFALIYGVITELAQTAVPDREVSLYDMAVNWCSTAIAAFLIVQRRRSSENIPTISHGSF